MKSTVIIIALILLISSCRPPDKAIEVSYKTGGKDTIMCIMCSRIKLLKNGDLRVARPDIYGGGEKISTDVKYYRVLK